MLTVDYDRLGLRAGDLLLDLGCGFGRHAYEALRRGARVVACDMAVARAASRCAALFEAMVEAGEAPPGGMADRRQRRRHPPARSPTTPSTASSPPRSWSTSPTTSPPSTS